MILFLFWFYSQLFFSFDLSIYLSLFCLSFFLPDIDQSLSSFAPPRLPPPSFLPLFFDSDFRPFLLVEVQNLLFLSIDSINNKSLHQIIICGDTCRLYWFFTIMSLMFFQSLHFQIWIYPTSPEKNQRKQ